MGAELKIETLRRIGLLGPDEAEERVEMYRRAIENLELSAADILTVRDLIEMDVGVDDAAEAVLLVLFKSLQEGSLCIELAADQLGAKLRSLLRDEGRADWLAGEFIERLGTGAYAGFIASSEEEYRPLVLHRGKDGKAYLYFDRFHKADLSLSGRIRRLLEKAGVEGVKDFGVLAAAAKEVLASEPNLDPNQVVAVGLPLIKNFSVISGGPGTGKTKVVATLLRILARVGIDPEKIALAAPTGRASHRLKESILRNIEALGENLSEPDLAVKQKAEAWTLHRLLGYAPSKNMYRHGEFNRLPAEIVIVDEASMVNAVLMVRLIEALRDDARLVLIGDKDQLPSVEAGAVLAWLTKDAAGTLIGSTELEALKEIFPADALDGIAAEKDGGFMAGRIALLTKNFRSSEGIHSTASDVNQQDEGVFDRLPRVGLGSMVQDAAGIPAAIKTLKEKSDGCAWIKLEKENNNAIQRLIEGWYGLHFDEEYRALVQELDGIDSENLDDEDVKGRIGKVFTKMLSSQILCAVHAGVAGTRSINRLLQKKFLSEIGRDPRTRLVTGTPIMITQNSYRLDLYNGDRGLILKVRDDRHQRNEAIFERGGKFVKHRADLLPPHEIAYAISVHKSQGSEFEDVLLILPPEGGERLLAKEIVYTGMTRAKEFVVVVAGEKVLRAALGKKAERVSGMVKG